MKKQVKNYLTGVGSIMDIAPTTDYTRFIPHQSAEERMRGHWERTGNYIRNAMNRFSDESEEKK